MASEMIESLAQAMYEVAPEYDLDQHPKRLITWDELGREAQEARFPKIRAVLQKLRDNPTEAMSDAGGAVLVGNGNFKGIAVQDVAEEALRAMIDKALED